MIFIIHNLRNGFIRDHREVYAEMYHASTDLIRGLTREFDLEIDSVIRRRNDN